jgi:hypothetical protein
MVRRCCSAELLKQMGESKGQYTSEKQKKLFTVYALVGNRIAEFEHMLKLTSDELATTEAIEI